MRKTAKNGTRFSFWWKIIVKWHFVFYNAHLFYLLCKGKAEKPHTTTRNNSAACASI